MIIWYKEKFVMRPVGLQNSGSICYFNALMQSLLSCPALTETIIKYRKKLQENPVMREYIKLLAKLINTGESVLSAQKIQIAIADAVKDMDFKNNFAYGQQDAGEGFLLFMDAINDFMPIRRCFLHRIRTTIKCSCSHKVTKSSTNYIFHIEQSEKLQNYMNSFESEVCDYKCAKCGNREPKKKTDKITMVPEILIVMIKNYNNKKNTKLPQELQFKGQEKLKYQLVALIEHSGSTSGGHYWAKCKRGEWYTFDDISVQKGDSQATTFTYMAFYHFIL